MIQDAPLNSYQYLFTCIYVYMYVCLTFTNLFIYLIAIAGKLHFDD